MRSRDSTSRPSLQIQGKSVSGALSNSAVPKCCCSSRSDGMKSLPGSVCFRGFGDEYFKRRNIRVPFDQRGPRPEAPDRDSKQLPYGFRHVRAVTVYEYLVLPDTPGHMTGKVELLYGACRHPLKVGAGVESVVARTDVEVVHIEQDAATGLTDECGQELPLGDFRAGEPQIAGNVLDENLT